LKKCLQNQAPSKSAKRSQRKAPQWIYIFRWPVSRTFHDNMNRRKTRELPGGQSENYTSYDATGNLLSKTTFNGKTITYSYRNSDDLLLNEGFNEGSIAYNYDGFLRRQSMTDITGNTTYNYDERDRLLAKHAPNGTITYGYDNHGNMTSLSSGNTNGANVSYSYDALNRPTTVTDSHRESNETSYSYDAVGNLANVKLPNGEAVTYQYDNLNRLTNMAATVSGTQIANYTYTLGQAGNRTNVAELSRSVTYTYDNLYRLNSETITNDPSNNGIISYTYDPVGNRQQRSSSVNNITTQNFNNQYDSNDRLTANGYQYDSDGSTTADPAGKTYTYDSLDRLLTVTGTGLSETFAYDGDGNKVSQTVNGVTTNYLVDTHNLTGYAQVLDEIQSGSVNRTYTYGLNRIAQDQLISGNWNESYYGYDGQGSVRYLMDATGNILNTYTLDAFGNQISSTGTTPNENLYDGEQMDANTGFYNLRARWMNPAIGRFQSMDTYEGNTEEPLSLHKYTFGSNDPIDRIDPSGNQDFVGEIGLEMNLNIVGGDYPKVTKPASLLKTQYFEVKTEIRPPAFQAGVKTDDTVAVDGEDGLILQDKQLIGATNIGVPIKGLGRLWETSAGGNGNYDLHFEGQAQSIAFAFTAFWMTIDYSFDIQYSALTNTGHLKGRHDGYPSYEVWVNGDKKYDFPQTNILTLGLKNISVDKAF